MTAHHHKLKARAKAQARHLRKKGLTASISKTEKGYTVSSTRKA